MVLKRLLLLPSSIIFHHNDQSSTIISCTFLKVTGLVASAWNVPMFDFVGQSSKMDDAGIYDSYVKIMPPLRRSAEVLLKTLRFFGWSHVAMIGGGLPSNTWDSVGALWSGVEALLRAELKLAAAVQFDTSDPHLVSLNIKYVATVARGKVDRTTVTRRLVSTR